MNIIAILEATFVISIIILVADYLDSIGDKKRESAIEKILARLFSKKK